MVPVFKATERFDPSDGERWQHYIQWANIPSLIEVISLDGSLCPVIGHELADDDWKHNVQENYRLHYFYDLKYLLQRTSHFSRRNILGLYRNPESHIEKPPAPGGFIYVGYDLIEEATQISALTNCDGFPESFSNGELNKYGLITHFDRAAAIKNSLSDLNPDEPHAQCEMYAIWKLNEN
jgi:hypothetical protein